MKGRAALMSSGSTEWETPAAIFGPLQREFALNWDVAASTKNAKCQYFFDWRDDALRQSWVTTSTGYRMRCWMNPPYGARTLALWTRKAHETARDGGLVVALLPARTDTKAFQDWIFPFGYKVRWLRGRIKFVGAKAGATFPSCIVIFWSGKP